MKTIDNTFEDQNSEELSTKLRSTVVYFSIMSRASTLGSVMSSSDLLSTTVQTNNAVSDGSTANVERAAAVVAEALSKDTSETWAHAAFRSRADRARSNYDVLLRGLKERSARVRKHVCGSYRYLRRMIERHEQRAMETLEQETKQQEKLILDRARLDYAIESKWVIERGLNQELRTLRVSSSSPSLSTTASSAGSGMIVECREIVRQKDRLRVAMLKDLYFELNTLTAVRETVNARLASIEKGWKLERPPSKSLCRNRMHKERKAVSLLRKILEDVCNAAGIDAAEKPLPCVGPAASLTNGYQTLLYMLHETPRTCLICSNFLPGHRFLFSSSCSHSHCVDCVKRGMDLSRDKEFACMECRKPVSSFVEIVSCVGSAELYTLRPLQAVPPTSAAATFPPSS